MMNAIWIRASVVACLLAAFAAGGPAQGVPFTFEKIVDTDTALPTDPLATFGAFSAPVLSGNNIVFTALGSNLVEGVYRISGAGATATIADTNTCVPGAPVCNPATGEGTYQSIFSSFTRIPSIDGENVAFGARDSGFVEVIGASVGGTLQTVATGTDPEPDTGDPMQQVLNPSIDGDKVVFENRRLGIPNTTGVRSRTGAGAIESVADNQTLDPDGVLFANPTTPFASDGKVAFDNALSIKSGLFVEDGGAFTKIADRDTPIPDGSGLTFLRLQDPVLDGADVAFLGGRGGPFPAGVYGDLGGGLGAGLGVIADTATAVPDGVGNFTRFQPTEFNSGLALDNGELAFVAQDSLGNNGIYSNIAGNLNKVIEVGQSLDGKTISSLSLSKEALDGREIAFLAAFDDGSSAIYKASIPVLGQPGTFALDGVGALAETLVEARRNVIPTSLIDSDIDVGALGALAQSRVVPDNDASTALDAFAIARINPFGGVSVGAMAQALNSPLAALVSTAEAEARGVAHFDIVGPDPSIPVDVDLNFSIEGTIAYQLDVPIDTVFLEDSLLLFWIARIQTTREGPVTISQSFFPDLNIDAGTYQEAVVAARQVGNVVDFFQVADAEFVVEDRFDGADIVGKMFSYKLDLALEDILFAAVGDTIALRLEIGVDVNVPRGSEFLEHLEFATMDFSRTFGGIPSTDLRGAEVVMVMDQGPAPVPEPATLTLFAFGLAGLGFMTRRRRRREAAA